MSERVLGNVWSDASKRVTWDPPAVPLSYPTEDQVREACERRDLDSLIRWNRFLPSPTTEEQQRLISILVECTRNARARVK